MTYYNRSEMELPELIILFLFASTPWFFAFEKLITQAAGYSIFIKSLIKCLSTALILFVPFFLLAYNNTIPTQNTTGSYSAEEIRQAVYLAVGFGIVAITYIGSGMYCYSMAKERYLILNPPPKKKEVLK